MLKKIRILDCDGHWWPVWAWVIGNIGIHRNHVRDGKFGRQWWVFTHVPTGCLVSARAHCRKKASVWGILAEIERLTWRGIRPLEDLSACELLELSSTIARDRGWSDDALKLWELDKRTAIDALHCKGIGER